MDYFQNKNTQKYKLSALRLILTALSQSFLPSYPLVWLNLLALQLTFMFMTAWAPHLILSICHRLRQLRKKVDENMIYINFISLSNVSSLCNINICSFRVNRKLSYKFYLLVVFKINVSDIVEIFFPGFRE